MSNKKFY